MTSKSNEPRDLEEGPPTISQLLRRKPSAERYNRDDVAAAAEEALRLGAPLDQIVHTCGSCLETSAMIRTG